MNPLWHQFNKSKLGVTLTYLPHYLLLCNQSLLEFSRKVVEYLGNERNSKIMTGAHLIPKNRKKRREKNNRCLLMMKKNFNTRNSIYNKWAKEYSKFAKYFCRGFRRKMRRDSLTTIFKVLIQKLKISTLLSRLSFSKLFHWQKKSSHLVKKSTA